MMTFLRRVTPVTIAMRVVIFVAAAAALWAATPSAIASPRVLMPVIVLALVPAFAPNSGVVTGVMVTVACGWMFGTVGLGEEVTADRFHAIAQSGCVDRASGDRLDRR